MALSTTSKVVIGGLAALGSSWAIRSMTPSSTGRFEVRVKCRVRSSHEGRLRDRWNTQFAARLAARRFQKKMSSVGDIYDRVYHGEGCEAFTFDRAHSPDIRVIGPRRAKKRG